MGTSTVSAFLGSNRSEIDLLQGYIVAGTHRGEAIPAQIKLPALAIHHRLEGCPSTPIAASEAIMQSRSHGIEEILIDTAATFILKT